MKKILCLVDLTETSNAAIEYAAAIAKQASGELVLLHVPVVPALDDVTTVGLGYIDVTKKREKEAAEKLLECRTIVEDQFDVPCQSFVYKSGAGLGEAVGDEVHHYPYDLVVMGTNGAESLRQYFFGTHADKLVRRLSIPLLIVPEKYVFKTPQKIVYATDYETSDAYVVNSVKKLMGGFNPVITVLHVSHKPSDISDTVYNSVRNELEDALNDFDIRYDRIFSKQAATGINDFVKSDKQDLLVLLSKSESLVDRIFGEGIIHQVNSLADYPVLVIHAPHDKHTISNPARDIVF